MIKLNLLPGEFKKKKVADKPKKEKDEKKPKKAPIQLDKFLKFGPQAVKIGRIAGIVLIGLNLVLGTFVLFKQLSLKSLDSQWKPLQPKKAELDKTNSEYATIEKLAGPIRQLVEGRFLWAKKINQVSDLMIPGIWLNRLAIEKQVKDAQKGDYVQTLILEGCAASSFGEETALIGKFIKGLQEAKEFSSDFSEIKSGPLEKTMLEKTPSMNFRVYCVFKKG